MKRRLLFLAIFLALVVLIFSYYHPPEKIDIAPAVTISSPPAGGPTETDQQLLDQLNQSADPNFDSQFQKIQSELQ